MKFSRCLTMLLLMAASAAWAASPPGLINYQGVLRDKVTGTPLNDSFEMTFVFCTQDSTADPEGCESGNILLTDTHIGAAEVSVANGLFTVVLGSGIIMPNLETSFAGMFANRPAVYLEVQVGGERLDPRVRVIASAYAQNAGSVQGVVNIDGSGQVGIGTITPTTTVDMAFSGTPVMMLRTTTNGGQDAHLRIMGSRDTSATADVASVELHNDNAAGTPFEGARIAMRNSDAAYDTFNADLLLFTNDGTALTEKVRILDNGNVGIGTLTPVNKLDVEGAAAIGAAYSGTSSATANGLIVQGNVGIGTMAPAYALDVSGDARIAGAMRDPSGHGGDEGQILKSTGSAIDWADPSSISDGDWTISVNDMYSTVSGNVGIGTVTPAAKLQVDGTADVQGYMNGLLDQASIVFGKLALAGAPWQSFTAGINGGLTGVEVFATSPLASGAPASATLEIYSGEGTIGTPRASQAITLTGTDPSWQAFLLSSPPEVTAGLQYTLSITPSSWDQNWWRGSPLNPYLGGTALGDPDNDLGFITYVSQKGSVFHVSTSGAVGIGTATPAYRLDLAGDLRLSGRMRDAAGNAGTDGQLLKSTGAGIQWTDLSAINDGDWTISGYDMHSAVSGNVGIGTSTPGTKLHVQSSGSTYLRVQTETDSQSAVHFATANYDWTAGTQGGAGGRFKISNATALGTNDYFTIQTDGNVGIGATAPAARLHVLGSGWFGLASGALPSSAGEGVRIFTDSYPSPDIGRIYAYDYGASGPLNLTLQSAGGNVGIGDVTPTAYQLQLSDGPAAKPDSMYWTVASDVRLKKEVMPFKDGLDVLTKIGPVRYKLNGLAGFPKNLEGIGVIAQEVKDIAPYTVGRFRAKLDPSDSSETELYDFNGSALFFAMINAIKELDERTKGLAAQNGPTPRTRELAAEPKQILETKDGLQPEDPPSDTGPISTGPIGPTLQLLPVVTGVEPGDVLVMNPANGEELYKCNLQADPMVVGIASSRASHVPDRRNEAAVILAGITWVKADALLAPIAKGDLLVTSATPGHAMKAQRPIEPGTVIGKALEPLEAGTGLIQVLVMLR